VPRLVHQPPKYSLHKPSRQAVVYLEGKAYYLGPHCSAESHRRYQAFLDHWRSIRHPEAASEDTPEQRVAAAVTP
jgi:hypothetical protein